MGVKYVKDFSFPSSGGFHGDVQRYAKGGHVTKMPAKAKASAKDMPARAKPNAPAKGAPKMASKPAVGKRQGYDKGGRVPGREMDRLPTKRPPGRGKDLAPARPFKGKYEGYANGGPVAEILPGDGRGGLDAVPMPEAPMYDEPMERRGREFEPVDFDPGNRNRDFLRRIMERDTQRMRGDAAQQMRDISALEAAPPVPLAGDEPPEFLRPQLQQRPIEPPVGALTPVPEEPYGRRSSGPPPPQGMKVNPNYGKPGQDYYVFIDDAARQDAMPQRQEGYDLEAGMRAGLSNPLRPERPAPIEPGFGGGGVRSGTGSLRDLGVGLGPMMPGAPVSRPPIAGEPGFGTLKGMTPPSVPSASAPRMERPEPIGLASMMPGAPVSRPPLAGEPGFGTSDALRRQMAAVKSGMDLQGTRGVKGSPLAEADRRAAVQGRAGVREDMGRRPAAAPAPKASRNALLRALASRMKAPTPRMGVPKPLPAVKPKPYMPVLNLAPEPLPPGFVSSPEARFAKGGAVKGKSKIGKVMGEYKAGKLHSGSKKGPKVTSEKQAMAIALSEARKAGAKIPKKAEGGIFNDEYMAYESKGPKTRYTAAKGRRQAKERAMERWAEQRQRHADAYAPGKSIDMPDKKKHGGMPVHRRKPMYGGGKC